jgi:hypothetical protein
MSDVNPLLVGVLMALFGFLSPPFGSAGRPADEPWCPAPEARQFDFWIGEWDVTNLNRSAGGGEWVETGTATNRVYAVVGGCAVVEHWSGKALGQPPLAIEGFSVRAFDSEREVWDLVLLWPIQGPAPFGTPSGRFSDGRGDFLNRVVNARGDTVRTRLSFSGIRPDAFQWNNAFSADAGATWDSTWIMHFRRRPATAPELGNGPTEATTRCPGEAHRRFDGQVGEWSGMRIAHADTVEVEAELRRILEGCAVMERVTARDGGWESFAVRALEPGIGWAEYGLAADRPFLRRREAATDDARVFTAVRPVAGVIRRTRWIERSPDRIVRIEEEASSPTGPWRAVAELHLRRVGDRDAAGV